jgi:hypothetical protein
MDKVLADPKLPETPQTGWLRLYDHLRKFATSINQAADGQLWKSKAITTTYSSGGNDHIILCSPAAPFTLTLPNVANMKDKRIVVKRANNTIHTITVGTTAGNIDGAATVTLTTAYQSREFYSDGVNYHLI